MNKYVSVNCDNFMKKMALVKVFYSEYHMKFEEIAFIVNSRPEIIQMYCKRLLH